MKRNLIEELIEIKNRNSDSFRDFYLKINSIENALSDCEKLDNEFLKIEILKYSSINIVACAEAHIKNLVKELIDNNQECFSNIKNLNQANNIKIDFNIISAFQSKTITVGDLISHVLSYNNFEDLISNINKIINKDLIFEIKNFSRVYTFSIFNNAINNFKNNTDEIIKSIKEIYRVRHIFCHEYGNSIELNSKEFFDHLKNFKIFLESCYIFVTEFITPNYPETTFEINIDASNTYDEKEKELQTLVDFIINNKEKLDEDQTFNLNLFNWSLKRWEKYRDSVANYKSSKYKKGTMYPLIYISSLTQTTIEKIESLKNEFEEFLRKQNYNN